MALYFFDSSALVKRYVEEVGTNWVQSITDPTASNTIFIAQITGVEIVAAVNRRASTNQTSKTDANNAITNFRYDFANQYNPLEITEQVVIHAMSLAEDHLLRAYDAVQLAAAMKIYSRSVAVGMTSLGVAGLTIVSADKDLNQAAAAEGLVVEDPCSHP